jgi:RimJ/RimL family protein N-acetyltransferase
LKNKYFFKSERFGFRNWTQADLPEFTAMNADKDVMECFPEQLTLEQSAEFLDRLLKHYEKHKYNYFATEVLETGEFIGFIGLAYQTYDSPFTPATDIGWRLKKSAWRKGYATEGAKRVLEYGFNNLKLNRIVSSCTLVNTPSENVMKKIGMTKMGFFEHYKLKKIPRLRKCVWYEVTV